LEIAAFVSATLPVYATKSLMDNSVQSQEIKPFVHQDIITENYNN
jgi:hypothetical protein